MVVLHKDINFSVMAEKDIFEPQKTQKNT